MIVAKTARNRRSSGEILLHERPHYVPLKPVFMIHDVVRNAELFGDAASGVDVLNRAAAALHLLGHAFGSGKAALVPELHGQTDNSVPLSAQHGGDGRRIDTARHGYGNGLCGHSSAVNPLVHYRRCTQKQYVRPAETGEKTIREASALQAPQEFQYSSQQHGGSWRGARDICIHSAYFVHRTPHGRAFFEYSAPSPAYAYSPHQISPRYRLLPLHASAG